MAEHQRKLEKCTEEYTNQCSIIKDWDKKSGQDEFEQKYYSSREAKLCEKAEVLDTT